jgi:hypothetical protein
LYGPTKVIDNSIQYSYLLNSIACGCINHASQHEENDITAFVVIGRKYIHIYTSKYHAMDKKYHTVGTIPKLNIKIVERGQKIPHCWNNSIIEY